MYEFVGRLSRFADEIAREEKAQVFAIRIDCSESRSVREAFEGVLSLGFVEVLVYNAYCNTDTNWQPTNFSDIRVESFQKSLAVSSVGAFHCAQQVSSYTLLLQSSSIPMFLDRLSTLIFVSLIYVVGNQTLFN